MFATKGWKRFSYDPAIAAWAQEALIQAKAVVEQPEMRKKWLQCQGTWFVGVDALASDGQGALGGVPLAGRVIDWLSEMDYLPFHPAQLSVIYPGYPKPRQGETEAGFRYRKNRDAAHVDGLLAVGPDRRRMLKEPHAFILGLPLNTCSPAASPMVVWEGSHLIMAEVFQKAFAGIDVASWADIDVTEVYQTAAAAGFRALQKGGCSYCSRRSLCRAPFGPAWCRPLAKRGRCAQRGAYDRLFPPRAGNKVTVERSVIFINAAAQTL